MVNCLNASLNVCAVVDAFLGIGFLIVSVATDYWRSATVTVAAYPLKNNQGLFGTCWTFASKTSCSRLVEKTSEYPAEFSAVIAMMLLAILFQGISMIIAAAAAIMKKKQSLCIIAILQFLAAGTGAAGLAIYANYYQVGPFKLNWSYTVGWIGIGAIGNGLVFLVVIIIRSTP